MAGDAGSVTVYGAGVPRFMQILSSWADDPHVESIVHAFPDVNIVSG